MHELSIALSLIDVACSEAERRGVHVAALHVKIGPLSGVVKGALVSAYELAREGTPLDGARLEIEEMPIVIRCDVCQKDHEVASLYELYCPQCSTPAEQITGGRELELTALEIE